MKKLSKRVSEQQAINEDAEMFGETSQEEHFTYFMAGLLSFIIPC